MQTIRNIASGNIGPKLYDRKDKKHIHERMDLKEWMYIQALYSKPLSKIDSNQIVKKALKKETISAGDWYRVESSTKRIPKFIKFFEIDMTQFKIENPSDYPTFNDFFTREIKPESRPVAEPADNSVIVSGTDCRLTVFNSLEESIDLWIKGKKFSFERMLNYDENLTERLKNGCLANLRLAPQDYHRIHSPVSGYIEKIVKVDGTNYETQPKVINGQIDVLGENERSLIVIDGVQEIGKVVVIAIGAERVSSVTCSVKEGDRVEKGQELGYFSYGGSDVVIMFERKVEWDEDIREQSVQGIETRVLTNERIGKFKF